MPANINETTVAIKIILFYTFAGEQLLCCYALTIHCYLTYCGHSNQEVLVNSFDKFFLRLRVVCTLTIISLFQRNQRFNAEGI